MAQNVQRMEAYALPIFRAGHMPVLGKWCALLLTALAGSQQVGDEPFNKISQPIAERLLEHCDVVLRVGGASQGADLMVSAARQHDLQVFYQLSEMPGCEKLSEPR